MRKNICFPPSSLICRCVRGIHDRPGAHGQAAALHSHRKCPSDPATRPSYLPAPKRRGPYAPQRDVGEGSGGAIDEPLGLRDSPRSKKDGSTRFCVDFRKLNVVTRKDAYPLPRIDTMHSRHACRLQMVQHAGPPQRLLAGPDRGGRSTKDRLLHSRGPFQFKVMSFGLYNAPATFQRLMDLVLAGLQWLHCLVYLDDVIVLGRTFDENLRNLESVFRRLREAGLRLKPSKCSLFSARSSTCDMSFPGRA